MFVGSYDFRLRQDGATWRITHFRFDCTFVHGNATLERDHRPPVARRSSMRVALFVVPYDSGLRGVRMGAGPERLLALGIAERLRDAGHPVDTGWIELPDDVFAEPGGLRLAELLATIGVIARRRRVRAAAITAYDPAYDDDGRIAAAALEIAAALAGAADAPGSA